MILSTHAVIGATAASFFPTHPLLAFAVGFGSHFIADAIPHWHYHVGSITKGEKNPLDRDMLLNRDFPTDLLKIAADGLIGLAIVYFFIGVSMPYIFSATLIGAFAGMLPDALQFLYWKWRHEPLVTLQRFHLWIHSGRDLDHWSLIGPATQVLIVLVCIYVTK